MTKEIIDKYLKGYLVYHYKGWYWVLHPETKEWIVNVADSGYTFFNRDFWYRFSLFFPVNDSTDSIRNWVVYKLGVPSSKHCFPDYIYGDYNWRDEFDESKVDDVVSNGNICFSIT
jgi:hypothetical protein